MKKPDQISSIFWLIFGAFWVCVATRLPLGTIHNPGPGFYPLLLGLLLLLFATGLFLQTWIKRVESTRGEHVFSGKKPWLGVAAITGALVVYGYLLEFLGFYLSTFLFMIFLFSFVGKQRWSVVIIGSFLATLGAYLMFIVLLEAQFPRGFIGL